MDELTRIKSLIHEIRGVKVMLDFDLAKLYEVKTSALNQAVKRNPKRFEGEEFMFQLTKEEWRTFKVNYFKSYHAGNENDTDLRSQFVTANYIKKQRSEIRGGYTNKSQNHASLCRLSPFGRITPCCHVSRSEKTNRRSQKRGQ